MEARRSRRNSTGRQIPTVGSLGPPVPPKAELRFAYEDPLGVPSPLVGVLLSDVVEWTVEAYGYGVLPRAYELTNVEDGLAEHVVVAAKLFAVQVDCGEGVEAVEDEAQPLVGPERFVGTMETHAIPPLAVLDPATFLFVSVVERILDAPCVQQSPVHVPWYGDGDPGLLIEAFLESPGPDPLTRSKVFEPCATEHRVYAAPTSRRVRRNEPAAIAAILPRAA